MPAMAHARPTTDEFDMAKLQKSLKQRQRNSVRNKHHVAKLTPAEIRSLNNSAVASITSSHTSSKGTSPSTSRRGTTTTPPASPDDGDPINHRNNSMSRNSVSRNSITNVPTPPLTPNGHRRPSSSSNRSHHQNHGHSHGHSHTHHHGHANGIIYAPRPRGHIHPAFMASNGISSRPSSSGSSTYRGLPTYRGPEVTRTGSMNMLQRPSPTIVANPLSNFSRPRQSLFSSSPERCRHDSQDLPYERTHSFQNSRANSMPNVSAPSSRPVSPPRVSDSPVSMLADESEKFPAFDPDDPHNQPKDLSEDEEIQAREIMQQFSDKQTSPQSLERPSSPVPKQREVEPAESPKKDKGKRFTLGTALFGGDKSASGENTDKAAAKLKKTRRRTLSFTKGGEVDQTSPTPDEGHTVDGAGLENGDYSEHPAIRPLSLVIPSEDKGKGKEIQSAPVYTRCACCGKIKKPAGYNNELSPVMENENLRTNFSFEAERTSDSTGRRSSDASRGKFTPIIPMPVSATETRQASIEPYTSPVGSSSNHHHSGSGGSGSSNHKSSMTSSPRKSKKYLDPPKFVRFASLHGRRNTDPTIIAEEDEYSDSQQQKRPLMNGYVMEREESYHDDDGAGMLQANGFSSHQEPFIARTQPVIDGPAEEKSKSGQSRPSNETSSDQDVFFTPNRGVSPAVVEATRAPQPQKARFEREDSFGALADAKLAIDFKDFVMAPPTTSPATDALMSGARKVVAA